MAVPSLTGDVKIVFPIRTFVLNTLFQTVTGIYCWEHHFKKSKGLLENTPFWCQQELSVIAQWECRQAESKTTGLRHHLSGIGTMPLFWRVSTEDDGDGTWGPGQPSTTITTNGCKLTSEKQRRLLRYLRKDVRTLSSGSRSITWHGVLTRCTLFLIRSGTILKYGKHVLIDKL